MGLSSFISSWQAVYKHNGGFPALARCLLGTARVLATSSANAETRREVEVITFSVVPELTRAWMLLVERAVRGKDGRILIGDCSGGFRFDSGGTTDIYPIYNFLHGRKLDYFIRNICTADYIVISDDDIMWLSGKPYEYAHSVLEENPGCAVVSLKPRDITSSVLSEVTETAMGSYCIVIRRKTWLEEGLSFRIQDPPSDKEYDWFYDTGDYANQKLIERGYDIHIAPEYIRDSLVTIEGASTWTLKIQKHRGNIAPLIEGIPIRQEKAYRVILFLEAIDSLLAEYTGSGRMQHAILPAYAERARDACTGLLSRDGQAAIAIEVQKKTGRIERRLKELEIRDRVA